MVIEMSVYVSTSYGYNNLLSIKLTNTQMVKTSDSFQQVFQLPVSQLQNYIPILASDFHNIRFVYNGAALTAGLESISNGIATIWVNIPVSIPANSSITLYMEVDPSLNFDGVYWNKTLGSVILFRTIPGVIANFSIGSLQIISGTQSNIQSGTKTNIPTSSGTQTTSSGTIFNTSLSGNKIVLD